MSEMNIVDAYKKFNKQLIILISGMSGSGKSKLAKNIADDFDLEVIKQNDFYKNPYSNDFTLFDGSTTTNWYTYDAYDWDKFNKAVNSKKSKGIVITGLVFPTKFLDFTPDFTISLSVKKAVLLEKMEKILEQNKDTYPEKYEEFKEGKTKYIFNKLSFPFFLSSIEDSVINKFINASDMTDDQIYDTAFDYIIPEIEKRVYRLAKPKTNKTISSDSASKSLQDVVKSRDFWDEYRDYSMKKSSKSASDRLGDLITKKEDFNDKNRINKTPRLASTMLKDLIGDKENKGLHSRSALDRLGDLENNKLTENTISESNDSLNFLLDEEKTTEEDVQDGGGNKDSSYGLKGDYLFW